MILSEIRLAHDHDTARIQTLLLQLGYNTGASTIEARMTPSHCGTDEVYVGIQDREVIALMSLIYFDYFPSAEKRCRITAIVVDEEVRNRGIGTALIDFAKERAMTEKCQTLEITTSLVRVQTQSFYERIGFHKTSYQYVQKIDPI